MDKKYKNINYILAGFMFLMTIFWLVSFMVAGVFGQDKIVFEGYNLMFSGWQPVSSQTSPYSLLLIIGSFLALGFYFLFLALGKKEFSKLFFGLGFVFLGSFFILLIKLSHLLAVIIALLIMIGGLILIYEFVRNLMYNKKDK